MQGGIINKLQCQNTQTRYKTISKQFTGIVLPRALRSGEKNGYRKTAIKTPGVWFPALPAAQWVQQPAAACDQGLPVEQMHVLLHV